MGIDRRLHRDYFGSKLSQFTAVLDWTDRRGII